MALVGSFLDPQHLITTFGLIGLLAVIFAEIDVVQVAERHLVD